MTRAVSFGKTRGSPSRPTTASSSTTRMPAKNGRRKSNSPVGATSDRNGRGQPRNSERKTLRQVRGVGRPTRGLVATSQRHANLAQATLIRRRDSPNQGPSSILRSMTRSHCRHLRQRRRRSPGLRVEHRPRKVGASRERGQRWIPPCLGVPAASRFWISRGKHRLAGVGNLILPTILPPSARDAVADGVSGLSWSRRFLSSLSAVG